MRFGLPLDYNVSVDPIEVYTEKTALTTDDLDAFSLELTKLLDTPIKTHLTTFNALKSESTTISSKSTSSPILKPPSLSIIADVDISFISDNLSKTLKLQNDQVNLVITQHKEKLRQEAELRERELQEQKKRQEELRLKQEEAKARLEKEKREQEKRKKLEEEQQLKIKQQQELLKQQELEKQKEIELLKEKELEKQKLLKQKQLASKTNKVLIEKQFLKYKQDIIDIKVETTKLSQFPDVKKEVNTLKRKINPKFGQLSNSVAQLQKITSEVLQLLSLAKSNEIAYKWILNFVAKAIVDQAETEVIVKPTAALPLARLSYNILAQIPEFSYYFIARIVKKCPYIIGYTCAIDTEEGRLRMGYKRKNNQWEDSVKYDERVSGICTIWSVLSRLNDQGQLPEYSFEASWKFLARLMNTDLALLTNSHFAIASNWYEAAAAQFIGVYGKQSQKLLLTLIRDWPLAVSDKKFPSAARLLILGEEWTTTNLIASLKEMER